MVSWEPSATAVAPEVVAEVVAQTGDTAAVALATVERDAAADTGVADKEEEVLEGPQTAAAALGSPW